MPLRAGIDHEIDAAFLAREVELAGLVEGGRGDRKDAPVAGGRWHAWLLMAAPGSPVGPADTPARGQ